MLETIQKHEGKPWSPSEETSITKYKGKSNCECSSIARGGRQIFGKRQIVDGFSHGNQSVSMELPNPAIAAPFKSKSYMWLCFSKT